MRNLRKKLLVVAGVVVGLVVVALLVVFFNLNRIVVAAVQTGGTRSLKVPTTLGGATVNPFGGDAGLSDLRIGSPEGFKAPAMFSVGKLDVSSSLGELFGAPVRVVSIDIDAPELVLEQAGGKFNFMVLKENLTSDKAPPPTDEPVDPNAEPVRLVIDSLEVKNAKVSLRPGVPGLKEQYDLNVPAISLKNIGNADGTQTGEEIGRVVSDLINTLAAKAAESEQLPPEVRQLLKLNVDNVISDVKAQVQDRIDTAKEDAEKKLKEEAGKHLGNLLDRDKKKDK